MFPLCQHSTLDMSSVSDNSSNYESSTFDADIMNASNFETHIEENYPYQQFLLSNDFSLRDGRREVLVHDDQRHEIEPFTYKWDEFRATSSHRIKPENNQTYFYNFASDNSEYSYKRQNSVRRTEDLPFMKLHTRGKCRRYLISQKSQHFIMKRKRRTVFNTQQILMLENIFKKNPYVSREERYMLMEMLNVSDRVIKVWFQNRRRLSNKRDKELLVNYNSDSSMEENDSNLTLDYVESKINQADEFGYVTLDDRAMSELITVIDSRLTIEIDLDGPCKKFKDGNSSNNIIYEPISPVRMQDGEEEEHVCVSQWEPHEPEESLRCLFDVQAFITK